MCIIALNMIFVNIFAYKLTVFIQILNNAGFAQFPQGYQQIIMKITGEKARFCGKRVV